MATIKLQSSDNEIFVIDINLAKTLGTINTMLNCGMNQGDDIIVPLPNVTSGILRKVLYWANYHKDDPVPVENIDAKLLQRMEEISIWDSAFINVDYEVLFELILAANYLDMNNLLELGCKTVANRIRGKDAAQIRELFNIENDFTEAEEQILRKENDWCETL